MYQFLTSGVDLLLTLLAISLNTLRSCIASMKLIEVYSWCIYYIYELIKLLKKIDYLHRPYPLRMIVILTLSSDSQLDCRCYQRAFHIAHQVLGEHSQTRW